MKIIEKLLHSELSEYYPQEELNSLFRICLKHLGYTDTDILLKEKKFKCKENYLIEEMILRLQKHEPIQYILGETEFYNLTFKVSPDTLIPRPETEELVDSIIQAKPAGKRILDIGTGSGCIPICLAKHLRNCDISSMDISAKALKIAQENATKHEVNIRFLHDNILQPKLTEPFDIYVSNPPYVMDSEKALMHTNVLKYEPETALYVRDEDPLLFYRSILEHISQFGKPEAQFFFEINEQLGKETANLALKQGAKEARITKDLFNKDRFIIGNF